MFAKYFYILQQDDQDESSGDVDEWETIRKQTGMKEDEDKSSSEDSED